jgi:hypothetical protein
MCPCSFSDVGYDQFVIALPQKTMRNPTRDSTSLYANLRELKLNLGDNGNDEYVLERDARNSDDYRLA